MLNNKGREEIMLEDRDVAFKCLVGSHNYNLVTDKSDKDYKVFLYPSFDDMFENSEIKDTHTSDKLDLQWCDIRKLPLMLYKSNVSFLETLFSQEFTHNDSLYSVLRKHNEEIARMNLPYLYESCMGMFNKNVKLFEKEVKKGRPERAYKHASSAMRIADFIFRYKESGYRKFGYSIWYFEGPLRQIILDTKNQSYPKEDVYSLLNDFKVRAERCKEDYRSYELNEDMKNYVETLVKNFTRLNLRKELLGGI